MIGSIRFRELLAGQLADRRDQTLMCQFIGEFTLFPFVLLFLGRDQPDLRTGQPFDSFRNRFRLERVFLFLL